MVLRVTLIYYKNLAVNCGIAGDKVENTFWRVENLSLPSGIEYSVIIFVTSNIYNEASSIANGLMGGIDTCFRISPYYSETLLTPSEEAKSKK